MTSVTGCGKNFGAGGFTEAGRAVVRRLREAGIGVNVHYMPIPAQPYYRDLGHDPANYPGAQAYYRQAISLPLFPGLSLAEQDQVVQTLESVLCA
mgnify:CR=1 FL=1